MRSRLLASVLLLLVGGAAFAEGPEVATGVFKPGEAYAPPADHAPARVSRAWVTTVAASGGRARVELPVTGRGRLVLWTLAAAPGDAAAGPEGAARKPVRGVAASLRTPSGRSLDPGEVESADRKLRRFPVSVEALSLELPGAQEAILADEAEPGLHQVEVEAADGTAVTVVAAEPQSPLTLAAWAGPLSRPPGEPVVLQAAVSEGSAPLTDARVTARLAGPRKAAGRAVRLFDDGRHGDGAAADGVYGAVLARLPGEAAGFWSVRFEAEGRDGRGWAFARTSSSGFMSEPPVARLLAGRVSALVASEAGERRVRVEAPALVGEAGRYRLELIVAGAPDETGQRPAVAWGESSQRLPAGPRRLTLDVPIGEAAGPLLLDLRLLALDRMGVAGRTTIELGP